MKRRLTRQEALIFFIWLYICSNCMMVFLKTTIGHYTMTAGTLLAILLLMGKLNIGYHEKGFIILYSALLLTTAIGSISQKDPSGIVQLCKFAVYIAIFIIILATAKQVNKALRQYMNIYCLIAVAISVQSIILFILVWFDLIHGRRISYPRFGGMTRLSFGIFGFGDAINYFGDTSFLRATSFFREPTKLGVFLITPALWSFAQYKDCRKKRWLLGGILMSVTFFLTFSRACFLALGIGLVSLLIFRSHKNRECYYISSHDKINATIKGLCCVIIVLLIGSFLYQFRQTTEEWTSQRDSYSNAFVGMLARSAVVQSEVKNIFIRDEFGFSIVYEKIKENPLGYGLGWTGREDEIFNPTALGHWIYSGGVLAALVLIFLYSRLFYKYCLFCMYSHDAKMRVLGASFIATTIQNMSDGTWCEPYYMLIIALMVMAVKTKEQENTVAIPDAKKREENSDAVLPYRNQHLEHDDK